MHKVKDDVLYNGHIVKYLRNSKIHNSDDTVKKAVVRVLNCKSVYRLCVGSDRSG